MNESAAQLATLWEQHRSRPFPRSRPHGEFADVDYFDLVELDTFVAGYVSRVVEGAKLQDHDLMNLEELHSRLQIKLRSLSGQTFEYFNSLATLARHVIAVSRSRH